MTVLLDPHAPEEHPDWQRCLEELRYESLLVFDYEGVLATAGTSHELVPMVPATASAFSGLLGIAGARTVVISERDSSEVRRCLQGLEPLAPRSVIGHGGLELLDETRRAEPKPGAALEALAEGFEHLLWVSANRAAEPAFAREYEFRFTGVFVGQGSAPPAAHYALAAGDDAVALFLTRLRARFMRLAPVSVSRL